MKQLNKKHFFLKSAIFIVLLFILCSCEKGTSLEFEKIYSYDGVLYSESEAKNVTGIIGNVEVGYRVSVPSDYKRKNVTIPAFYNGLPVFNVEILSKSIEEIAVDENNSYYSSQTGILYNKDKTALIFCPPQKSGVIKLPSSVVEIGNSAFYGCSNLTSVELPFGLENIDSYTFAECRRLQSVELPASVKKIGLNAFENCTKLTSIEIPSSVTYIDWFAFYGCYALTTVYISSNVETIGYGAFDSCSKSLTIYCEKNSYAQKYAQSFGISYNYY